MLALGEMCFVGMGIFRAWGQLKRGFEVQLKRGFEVLALGEMYFQGMGAVEKGV